MADFDDILDEFLVASPATARAAAPQAVAASQDEYTVSDLKTHAKQKGMWAGALTPVPIKDLMGMANNKLISIKRPHTPALLKIFDEIIVNATDHSKEHSKDNKSKNPVTEIRISFDKTSGRFSVYNDGPGIPVKLHEGESIKAKTHIYVPEVAFSYFLAGTNINKELANVKGGINGLGAKIANVHSVEFNVETVDSDSKKFYSQTWRNRLDMRFPPEIRKKTTADKTHTQVSFIPAYKELGYPTDDAFDDLDAWIQLRAHQAAAYVGARVNVTYNDVRCATVDIVSFSRLMITSICELEQAVIIPTVAKATVEPFNKHPLNLAVVVLPAKRTKGSKSSTIINGVITNKGTHIQYFKTLVSAAVEGKLRKATKDVEKIGMTETLSNVYLVIIGSIPGVDWGGQRKDELQVRKEILENYKLSKEFLKAVRDAITERILMSQDTKTEKVVHDKYVKAKNAGKAALKADTDLLAAEGDSAMTLLRTGLSQSKAKMPRGGPSFDWCGIISLQGVIVNAAREVKTMETADGEVINVRSAKLRDNKRLMALADAFGLKYDRTYETSAELATLNYGRLILCVDQDLDGTGKIAALVLVWIYQFWPALIAAGRIGRFMTPLVRARRKQELVEFYYEEELHRWLEEDPTRARSYAIKYYKGLATHDEDEAKSMFKPEVFRRNIYTYKMDDGARRLFEVYFGTDPSLRKAALVTPVSHLSREEMELSRTRQEILVGRVQFDIDTKSYKNDALKRQIAGGPDALNPARRKILLGAMMRFSGESANKELKIFQLGGYVADKCFYHHGDASLNSTIVYLAQSFPGARKYPYLTGVGQFGSRHGDKAGSARYISVKLSPLVKVTFPPEDRWHLKYVYEDGIQAEPEYFVPVVPMTALESYRIVSEGWKHDSHGRDLDAVLAVVEAYISGDERLMSAAAALAAGSLDAVLALSSNFDLPPSARDFDGDFGEYKGKQYSFGFYVIDEATEVVTITELPMGVTTASYIETLSKPGKNGRPNPRTPFIESINDQSSSDKVELIVNLRKGSLERIKELFGSHEIDPITDVLMLRSSLQPHLNYYSINGAILEYSECYLASILYWAPLRAKLYQDRVTRRKIIAELKIIEESEIIRYISMASSLNLASVEDDSTAESILKSLDFPKIDSALLHRPEYTDNGKLRELIINGPASNYNYILDIKERELVRSAAEKRRQHVERLRAEEATAAEQLNEKPVACASLWRSEIGAFLEVVQRGIETKWRFK